MNLENIYESFFDTYRNMGYMISELSQGLLQRAADRAERRSAEAGEASGRVKDRRLKSRLKRDSERKAAQAERFKSGAQDRVKKEAEKVNPKKKGVSGTPLASVRTGKPIQATTDDDRYFGQNDQNKRKAERQKKEDDMRAKAKRIKKDKGYGPDSDDGGRMQLRSRDEKSDKARYKKQLGGGGISRAEKARLNNRYKG